MKRNPWNLLTARGKFFLLAGLGIVLGAMLLGERDVLWLGALLVLLPGVALFLITRTRLRLACERGFEHGQIEIGQSLEGQLTLTKRGSLPAGLLKFEEHVPPALGRRPRFAVNNTTGAWERTINYPIIGHQRGRFRIGPLLVRSTDTFGLVKFDRQFTATSEVMVTPTIHSLGSMNNIVGGGSSGESRPQKVGVVGHDDVLIREYRQGDDVRRVHWRSTARRGELMVRREEQAWDPAVTLILDSRKSAHGGVGRDSSFEYAVSAAASVALHFMEDGFRVELFDADGSMLPHSDTPTGRQQTLTTFTDAELSTNRLLADGLSHSMLGTQGQLVVAVTGRLTPQDAEMLLRARRQKSQGLAIVVDADSFVPRRDRADADTQADHDQAVATLKDHLWRVVEVSRTTDFAEAWRDLERIGAMI
ncbi:DUF58 domain-containing protein [Mariniluteicoccus endophyticus]